ncbi:hypothetical protein [Sulfurovum sp.]|uniref:hypothetical protein n=1 Tax=Sulfurovum sp. TaxID=1969726 RepID=UPI002867F8E2|nr:hypothetical protein [Sulfurovum sp.]
MMKTIKENINSKVFNKSMIYTRGREDLRQIIWDYDVVEKIKNLFFLSDVVPKGRALQRI